MMKLVRACKGVAGWSTKEWLLLNLGLQWQIDQDCCHRVYNKIKTYSIMNHQSWGCPGSLDLIPLRLKMRCQKKRLTPQNVSLDQKAVQKNIETKSNNNHSEFFAVTVVSESCVYIYIYAYTVVNRFHTHQCGTAFSQQTFSTAHLQGLTKSHFITQQHSTATIKSKRQTLLDGYCLWRCLKIYPKKRLYPKKGTLIFVEQPQ